MICRFGMISKPRQIAFAGLILLVVPAVNAKAQCVLGSKVDGFVIGMVTAVEYSVDPTVGCRARIAIEPLGSVEPAQEPRPGHPVEVTMLGGFCEGRPVLDTTCPGGTRTFSFAIGELALVAFCRESEIRWVVDKRTCWTEAAGRSSEGASSFLREVRSGRHDVGLFRAYQGFSLEVLQSPDPRDRYARPKDSTAWFLHQVHDSSSWVTVADYIASLGLANSREE